MKALRVHVERIVRPIRASSLRKDRMREELLAPNGFLHAATVIGLADTACGYACIAHLPENAQNFTTLELKSNHVSTAREGKIVAIVGGSTAGAVVIGVVIGVLVDGLSKLGHSLSGAGKPGY